MIPVINMLAQMLDLERPGWRNSHILLHDNFHSFVASETKKVLTHLNILTMLISPVSFQGLVVEGCFEVLKAASHETGDFDEDDGELQEQKIETTKKVKFMKSNQSTYAT